MTWNKPTFIGFLPYLNDKHRPDAPLSFYYTF